MLSKVGKIVGVLIILGISIWMTKSYIYQNTGETKEFKYHWDERLWVSASVADYHMFFKGYQRDFTDMDSWFYTYAIQEGIDTLKMSKQEKQWYDRNMWTAGWKAHTIGKYFMGFAAVNFGGKTNPQGYFYRWDKPNPLDKGKAPGSDTPDNLVQLARWPNSIMNILTIFLVLFIGWRYFNFLVGFVGALWLSLNKNLFQVSNMAGVDGGGLFFSTLTIALALIYLENFRKPERTKLVYLLSVLIGISFPIAVGWKFSAALVGYIAIGVFGLLALILFFQYINPPVEKPKVVAPTAVNKGKKALARAVNPIKDMTKVKAYRADIAKLFVKMGISGAIIAVLTWVIFIYSNPILYSQPLKKVKVINESVDEFFKRRAIADGHYKMSKDKTYATQILLKRNFVVEDAKSTYHGTIGTYLKFKNNFLDGLLFVIGFIFLSLASLKTFKEGIVNPSMLLLISTSVLFYGTIGFLWADYNRYYIPIYPMVALVMGFGVWKIVEFVKGKIKPKTIAA